MNFIAQLDERFPVTTVGIVSGLGAWILDNSSAITGVAGIVGTVCSATLASIMLAAKVASLLLRFGRWIRQLLRNRAQRRAFERDNLP